MRRIVTIIMLVGVALAGMATAVVVAQRGGDSAAVAALAPFVVTPVREGAYIRMLPRGGAQRLGVTVQELTPQLADYFGAQGGALVVNVRRSSPADRADLRAGDVITGIDGIAVMTTADLRRWLQRDLTNVALSISVRRDRLSQIVNVKIR
jgi:S1-C subfamily serine protease